MARPRQRRGGDGVYFDPRLWQFTKGVRLRIAGAVVVGLMAAAVGIGRLALLGWLLAMVFQGAGFDEMVGPSLAVAGVMLLRGVLEYWRNMVAHRTAARVQLHIRARLYDQVVALGPAYFGFERTGDVITAMVDGVEQLEIFFGQYLPQMFVAALTPLGVFACVAFLDLPVAAVLLGFALFTLIAPSAFHSWDEKASLARAEAYGAFGAEFLDSIQGLATLKAFGQSEARGGLLATRARALFESTMWVLATNALARGITDTGIAVGAAVTLGFGAYRVVDGAMSIGALLVILMMGIEVYRPMRELRALLHDGMTGLAAAKSIFNILDATPLIEPSWRRRAAGRCRQRSPSRASTSRTRARAGPRTRASASRSRRASGSASSARRAPASRRSCGSCCASTIRRPGASGSAGGTCASSGSTTCAISSPWSARTPICSTARSRTTCASASPTRPRTSWRQAARAANAHEFISPLCRKDTGPLSASAGFKPVRRPAPTHRDRPCALLRDAPILVLDEALSSVDAENEAVIQPRRSTV